MRPAALFVAFALALAAAAPLAGSMAEARSLDYAGYEDVATALEAIAAEHPSFARLETLGTTFEGRGILALRLCAGSGPAALVMGGHHAREPASAEIALSVAEALAGGYETNGSVRWLLDNREIWIVPMVNPDGIEYVLGSGDTEWRKNRRPIDANGDGTSDGVGVDLNRNYGHRWGEGNTVHDPASQEYCGTGPFSEAETKAIRMLAEREDFSVSVSFHSYGNVVYYPWNNGLDTSTNATLESLASEVAERNGYISMEGNTAYSTHGDSDDWLYANMSAAPVTIEIGAGFLPSRAELDELIPPNVEAALYACGMAGRAADASLPDWTLAVYMAADNNLADQALLDLNEMEAAPASADINTIVLYDGANTGDSALYRIAHDEDRSVLSSPVLADGGAVVDAASHEAAMNDPETLSKFLDWTWKEYPAQNLGIVLWNHGNDVLGGLCVDGGGWLGTAEACSAIRGFASSSGKTVGLVGLDLCWGASLEMAAELRNCASVFVASELEEPDTGWDYADVIGRLAADTNAGPEKFGAEIVDSYSAKYSWVGYGSMGAFSIPLLGDAFDAWNSVARTLSAYAYYNRTAILDARNATGGIWSSRQSLVDALSFCGNLDSPRLSMPVRTGAGIFKDALSRARLATFSGYSAAGATGLYVYHPPAGGYDPGYAAFQSAEDWAKYLAELANPTPRALVAGGAPPTALNTTGPYTFEAWLTQPEGANVTLHYSQAGGWVAMPMVHAGGGRFMTAAPGQPDGTTINYYFESKDSSGFQTRFPESAGSALSVVVRAFLDLYVSVANVTGEIIVGRTQSVAIVAGNAGMEPSWAMVRLYTPDGIAGNKTVFLSNGAHADIQINWTPSAAGNGTLLASVVPANASIADSVAQNNTARMSVEVLPKGEWSPALALGGLAFAFAVIAIALAIWISRSKAARKRDRAVLRIANAEELVSDLERGGYDVSGARKELASAGAYLREAKFEWAECAAGRAESQAIKAVSEGGGPRG
jgi:carboxypeptidase T